MILYLPHPAQGRSFLPLLVPANGIFDKEGLGRLLKAYWSADRANSLQRKALRA